MLLVLMMICCCLPANAVKRQSAVTPTPMIPVSPSPAPVPADGYGRVTEENAELRIKPAKSTPVKYTLSSGETVKLIEYICDEEGTWWVHVDYADGMPGYILSESIRELKPDEVKEYLDSLRATPAPALGTSSTLSPTPEKTTVEIGDIVTFGSYPQTSDGKEEPIEWLVLDVQGSEALILSRYGLDTQQYNIEMTSITWEECTLRSWLNGTFLNKAFTAQEQTGILLTNVDNSDLRHDGWNTGGGNNTQDKVFLLSYEEANEYLGVTDGDRMNMKSRVVPTDYAIQQGAYTIGAYKTAEGKAPGWWWLRSPGINQLRAAIVDYAGSAEFYSTSVDTDRGCVRPVLWINLDSAIFQSKKESDNIAEAKN